MGKRGWGLGWKRREVVISNKKGVGGENRGQGKKDTGKKR